MATYLITGCGRGIGLELVKQLLEVPSSEISTIFAVTRAAPSSPLQALLDSHSDRLKHITANVGDTASVVNALGAVKAELGSRGLDVLVNNAGTADYTPGGPKDISPQTMADIFEVNVIGVQRMTATFLPLLEAGKLKRVINVSSTVGSITHAERFKSAPSPAYKTSKAALNMLNKQYAIQYADAGFTFLAVSPGWLKTDLGGVDYADLEVPVGVAELKRIMLEATPSQNGQLVNIHVPGQEEAFGLYDGKEIPW